MRGDKKTKRKNIENLMGYLGLFLFYIVIPLFIGVKNE